MRIDEQKLKEKLKSFEFQGESVPEHMHAGIINWIVYGIRPGDFLNAVIENNLALAVMHADPINYANLKALVGFFHNEAPASCYGGPENVKRWEEAFKMK